MTDEPNAAPTRMPDVAVSLIRTWVPIVAGGIITAGAAAAGIVVDTNTSATVAAMVSAAVAGGYYGLARLLENVGATSRLGAIARTIGRYMLGGIVAKPAYMTDAEYAAMLALVKRQPSRE